MVKNHLKRFGAPGFWKIGVKSKTWIVRPSPGPHSLRKSIPAIVVLRDMLKFTKTRREARVALLNGLISVNGRKIKSDSFPVGLMDVVSIANLDKHYRIVPTKSFLDIVEISKDEANKKLVKITGKSTVKGGHIQLNFHDGSNILMKQKDPKKSDVTYKVGDSLLIELPSMKVLDHVEQKSGNQAIVVGGSHISNLVKLIEIRKFVMKPDTVTLAGNEKFDTLRDYVLMVGKDKPLVTVGETK